MGCGARVADTDMLGRAGRKEGCERDARRSRLGHVGTHTHTRTHMYTGREPSWAHAEGGAYVPSVGCSTIRAWSEVGEARLVG